jgi:hypothetical protein
MKKASQTQKKKKKPVCQAESEKRTGTKIPKTKNKIESTGSKIISFQIAQKLINLMFIRISMLCIEMC